MFEDSSSINLFRFHRNRICKITSGMIDRMEQFCSDRNKIILILPLILLIMSRFEFKEAGWILLKSDLIFRYF